MTFDIADTTPVTLVSKAGQAVGIDSIRYKIIKGEAYYLWDNSWNQYSIAKDSSWNLFVYSGGTKCHKIKLFAEVDASVNYRVFEFDTSLNAGTRIFGQNYNRNYGGCGCLITKKGKFGGQWAKITGGTEIHNNVAYAVNTTNLGGSLDLGSTSEEYSFITSPTKYYVLHLYNRGPNALHLHVHIRFTEYSEALTS